MNKSAGQKRRRRGLIWVSGAVVFVAALLYWEQTALLYLLSTLAMCGLLIVVAFSDLEGKARELTEAKRQEQTAPARGGEMATAAAPRPERRTVRQRRRGAA